MNKKVLVVGSGSNHQIENSNYHKIFCANSSFTRLKSNLNSYVVTSDAFLFNEDILNSLPPIDGLSGKESNKIRLKKYSKYYRLSVEKIFIFEGPIKLNNRKELINKQHLLSKDIFYISWKDKWTFFNNSFSLKQRAQILVNIPGIINKLKFVIQHTFKLKMSLIYRPSMGIFSIMVAIKEDPKYSELFIDGISNSPNKEKFSIYGDNKVYFNKYAHHMDQMYYDIITKKFSIKII